MAFLLAVYLLYRTSSLGIVVFPIVFLLTFVAATGSQPALFVTPVIKKGWLIAHIAMIFTGYAALFLSFGASLLYLVQERRLKSKNSGLLSRLPATFRTASRGVRRTHSTTSDGRTPWRTTSTGLPMPLHAGAKVTLTDAHAAMAGQLWLPATLPAPTAVYLRRDRGAVVVTLAYATAPHLHPTADTGYALILTEIANAGHPLFEKILGTNTSAIMVTVARHPGVFINGPQEIITIDPSRPSQGQPAVHEIAARSSANTIIWSGKSITYRLEGDFSRQAAVALASTIR